MHEIKHNYDLEIILAEITTTTNMKIILGSCYRPPNEDQTWIVSTTFLVIFVQVTNTLFSQGILIFPKFHETHQNKRQVSLRMLLLNYLMTILWFNSTTPQLEKITYSISLSQTFRNWLKLAKFCPLLKQISLLITVHVISFDLFVHLQTLAKN